MTVGTGKGRFAIWLRDSDAITVELVQAPPSV
jgi:translation initiation factor IF-1